MLDRLQAYFEPLLLLSFSLFFFPITLLSHPFLLLTSPSTFRSKWFARFWKFLGPKMAASPEQVDHIDDLLSRAHGTVLEIGPGGGDQMYHFKPVAGRIERIYGAEPNPGLHEALLQKARDAGLGGKYTALNAGAEPRALLPALRKAGVLSQSDMSSLPSEGLFDTIITIKSMCSASQAEMASICIVIQSLLKPGGEFLFFEHVANNTDSVTKMYVWVLGWVWPLAMGGCRLNGKLDRVVMQMSGWKTQVHTTKQFKGHNVFRYVKGIATKN